MGCAGSCVRAVYSRAGPCVDRTNRIQPEKETLQELRSIRQSSSNAEQQQRVKEDAVYSFSGEYLWSDIDKSIPQSPKQPSSLSWCGSTVYCYVVSTFEDFHSEREILAQEVFPEIKQWCNSSSMQFIPIDLYWGLENEVKTAEFLKTSILEMSRCLQAASKTFIVILVSETFGWVPSREQLTEAGVDITKYPEGTSLFEILIAQGTFLAANTNILFMFREPCFLTGLPRELLYSFKDFAASSALNRMKQKIRRFFDDKVYSYRATCNAELSSAVNDEESRKYVLRLDSHFASTVSETILNKLQKQKKLSLSSASIQFDYQEKELKKHASVKMLGKNTLLQKIDAYIRNKDSNPPLVIVGERGSGKSTVMAHCIQLYRERERAKRQVSEHKTMRPATSKKASPRQRVKQALRIASARVTKISQPRQTNPAHPDSSPDDFSWNVFHHFVTPFPRSADLRHILQRLWTIDTFSQPRTSPMSLNVNKLGKEIKDLLSKQSNRRTLIFIDGIDQISDERSSHVLRWLPVKLAPTVKVILSLGPKSDIRKVLASRDPPAQEVSIGSLNFSMCRQLISQQLSHQAPALSPDIVDTFLNKIGICNPLFACELVKYCTRKADENLMNNAEYLPDDLAKLYSRIVYEIESGSMGRYCIAAMCLLHCAHYGLQESELFELLSALSPTGIIDESERASSSTSRNVSYSGSVKAQRQGMERSDLLGISSQVSPHSQPHSRTSLADGLTLQPLLQRRISPTHSLFLHEVEKSNPNQLSPKLKKGMSHSHSYPSANELQAALPPVTPEGSPTTPRTPQYLNLPPSRASPSISLLSISTPVQLEQEIVDLDQKPTSNSPKPLVGLERVTMLDQSDGFPLLPFYQFSQILQKLRPLLRCIGRPGESRYCLANQAAVSAVKQQYFRYSPTDTFPFSFSPTSTFFGADKDHTFMSLVSRTSRRGSSDGLQSTHHSRVSTPASQLSTANTLSLQMDRDTLPIEMSKRYEWWHARLAGYFASYSTEERRSEELPYHLAKTQSYGQLSHCLVHLPLFERLCKDDNVMDLLFYWQCTGGYSNIANMYQHALEAHEISGASNQEMVRLKHKIAVFLHQAGETEAAHQILVDAIQIEEDRLKSRPKIMASLTLTMTEFLSSVSKQQAEHMHQITEPEYRLLQFAGRSVEFHRSLEGAESQRNLAHLLLILSHHLQHYSILGGSPELSSANALEQAREAAQESTDSYLETKDYGRALNSYLQWAATYSALAPSRAMEILREAESLCLKHYGASNTTMLKILYKIAILYRHHLHDEENAITVYDTWAKVNVSIYGKEAAQQAQAEFYAIEEPDSERETNSPALHQTTTVIIEHN